MFASGTVSLAAVISFGVIQWTFVPYAGASGGDVQATGLLVECHGLHVPDEFGRGRGEDGLPLGQDAAADGRGDQAALGHHQTDRRAERDHGAGRSGLDIACSTPQ
ncbi:hypothetical protein [Streptomyces sp. 62]|jgi:hypothetical protein